MELKKCFFTLTTRQTPPTPISSIYYNKLKPLSIKNYGM